MVTLDAIESKIKNTNAELASIRDNFVESIGQLSASLGLSRVAGQLYALLYLSERPISLDEMVETLKISKGNVSVNIRELEKWGAVRKVWVKGSRKDYYEADLDVLKVVLSRLKEGLQHRLNGAMETVDKAIESINNHDSKFSPTEKEMAAVYTKRLNNVKELHTMAKSFLENISKIV